MWQLLSLNISIILANTFPVARCAFREANSGYYWHEPDELGM